MSCEFLVLFDNPPDPGHHLGDPGVDTRVLGLGTSDAPGDDPDLRAGPATDEQRAAAVALEHRSGYLHIKPQSHSGLYTRASRCKLELAKR